MKTTVDLSRLGTKVSEFVGILLGQGYNRGDAQNALTIEAGQCAWKIAEELGPVSTAEAAKKVEKDVKGFLNSDEGHYSVFTGPGQHHATDGSMLWLTAGPNWLQGIALKDYQPTAGISEAVKIYYDGRKKGGRGKAYEDLGRRGKQHVHRLNRTRVSGSAFEGVKETISKLFGQSKAAFARTAAELLPNKRIPGWVREKIPLVISNGKSILTDGRASEESPFIEFGSRAKGVSSNPVIADKIQLGVASSQRTLEAKIRKVISGQTYNWNTGQVFKPTQFDEN